MVGSIARVTRSKAEARMFYTRISRFYDFSEGSFERKYIRMGLQKVSVREGDVVLEVGVGTGESIVEFARLVGPSGKVYGVDISEGMLEVTRTKLMETGLLDRVELVCEDAVHLSFQDGFFDAVFMSFTLELFDIPEIPRVLTECYRVLKNGGRIGVVSLSKKEETVLSKMYEWLHGVFPRLLDCRPIFAQDALNEAGFVTQDAALISMWGLPVEVILGKKSR
jgi:ubiquinone/menaquinone biosynthesis C-methylase UbiE